jgi:uncharacterized iron-regulated membrane protein
MAGSTRRKLRQLWFQVHKWLGLALAVLVIPISLTGSALVWHDWLDEALNPERKVEAEASRSPAFYAEAARLNLAGGETLLSLTMPEGAGPVLASAARAGQPRGGRPVRTVLYLHPADGRLLDRTASNEGAVHVMHVLHGSLMVPGVGRQIVGWVGVAMLVSALSGLWLWWPLSGRLSRAFGWKRSPDLSGRLHHQGGFWIAIPLAVLSFTGAWISFPAFFGPLAGDPPAPSAAERMRRMGAAPIEAPRLGPDQALGLAAPLRSGDLQVLTWPTAPDAKWKLSFARTGGPAEVTVDDGTGAVTPPKAPQPETTSRLMRRIHDGTGTGPVWQLIIFLGGIIPAALAVTGILMWFNRRRRRALSRGRWAAASR